MSPVSDAARSRKKREKERTTVPTVILAAKKKTVNQQKQVKQLARRLEDKGYDDKLLQLNRDRVKRFRDKKRAMGKENTPPVNDSPSLVTRPQSNSENFMTDNHSNSNPSLLLGGSSSGSASADTSSLVTRPQSNSENDMSDNSSTSTPSHLLGGSGSGSTSAGDFVTPISKSGGDVRLSFSTPSRSRQKEAGEKRRRETLRDKNSDIDELHNKVEKLEDDNFGLVIENCDLKRRVRDLEAEKSEKFSWMKILWKNCTEI